MVCLRQSSGYSVIFCVTGSQCPSFLAPASVIHTEPSGAGTAEWISAGPRLGAGNSLISPVTGLSRAPHTDELRTVERIRKISPTQLEDVITIHDPEYYSQDWQARFVYTLRNDVRLEDYVCGEPHRDISGVAAVRRP
jgi:hypothetical protein